MPRVTVLMAVYNGSRFIREAIDSVLSQTLMDFEFLIVDDGSTDATASIVSGYDDPRVRLVSNERNLGLSQSLNRGLSLARSEFIARLDADDVCEPERLAAQVSHMDAHPELGLLGCWYREIDDQGGCRGKHKLPVSNIDLKWSLLFHCPFLHSAAMIRKSVLDMVGRYDETLAYSMDYDLWCRIGRSAAIANIEKYLVRWRNSGYSMTSTYGERREEGHRIRVSGVGRMLAWEPSDAAGNDRKFRVLSSLAVWPRCGIDKASVRWGVPELLRLHTSFSAHLGMCPRQTAKHRKKVLARVSRQLIAAAYKYPCSPGILTPAATEPLEEWPGLSAAEALYVKVLMLATPGAAGGLRMFKSVLRNT